MVGRRDTGHRGQGDVRHGSHFKDMHKNPNEHVATCMGPNPHPKRMLLCPAFLHVGPKKHAGVRESAGRCGRGSMDGAAAVARTAMALEAS